MTISSELLTIGASIEPIVIVGGLDLGVGSAGTSLIFLGTYVLHRCLSYLLWRQGLIRDQPTLIGVARA